MPKYTLDADTVQGARNALAGLSGALAKQEAERWAAAAGCHVNRIYEVTKDVRPQRKQRTDRGKRQADINHPMVKFAMELITVQGKVDPQAAIEIAEAQDEFQGEKFPVSLGTLRRYVRELGINRGALRNPRRPHRRFEAKSPLDIFQFDISGVKERWLDVRTRRILKVTQLDVSKNHPNQNPIRVPLWKFALVDDYSRLKHVRFVACLKPNSCHVIDFLWEAFRTLGIPKVLYTDNDAIIVSRRMRRAASILDKAFTESGGFRLDQHKAGNPNATGKVENCHLWFERFEKRIGVKYKTPDFETLNKFAANVCERGSWQIHRDTGVAPMLRFREGHAAMRVPPDAVLDSAFKAGVFTLSIAADLTFGVEGKRYQLPRSAQIMGPGSQRLPNPFLDRAGRRGDAFKVEIIWPPDVDYFVAIVDGTQFEIDRKLAVADAADEYKTAAESVGQRTIKTLEASAKERKAAHRAAGTDLNVPLIDSPAIAASGSIPAILGEGQGEGYRVAMMPRRRIETDPALLASLTAGAVPPSMVEGRLIDYWTALGQLIDEGAISSSEFDKTWLKSIFNGRDEINDTELREALGRRGSPAVREGVA